MSRYGRHEVAIVVSSSVPASAYQKERLRAFELGYKPKIVRMTAEQVNPVLREYETIDRYPDFDTLEEQDKYEAQLLAQTTKKLQELLYGGGSIFAIIVTPEFVKALDGYEGYDGRAWEVFLNLCDEGVSAHHSGDTSFYEWDGTSLALLM